MKVWMNRSSQATCMHCRERIMIGEPCILVDTQYKWRYTSSVYLHAKCIDDVIDKLTSLKKEVQKKVMICYL